MRTPDRTGCGDADRSTWAPADPTVAEAMESTSGVPPGSTERRSVDGDLLPTSVATAVRSDGTLSYSRAPGHEVWLASRWPEMRSNVTSFTATRPVTGMPCSVNFHANSFARALVTADGTAAVLKSPITDAPNEPEL